MTRLRVPDQIGEPIRAYRMWRVSGSRLRSRKWAAPVPNEQFGVLFPFNEIDQAWRGRKRLVARCYDVVDGAYRSHESPDPRCRCGIYGLKELAWVEQPLLHHLANRLAKHAESFSPWSRPTYPGLNWMVVGSVLLWGKVIEGQRGYRAQHAYPETLWLLPPARIGGTHTPRSDARAVELARDLLVVLRHRYQCQVGYAGYDHGVNDLLGADETGWFFSWRLSATGRDTFGRALGKSGEPSLALPTVSEALELWLASRPDGASYEDRRLVREHLSPTFGHVAMERAAEVHDVPYTPHSRVSGKPYAERTVTRHRKVVTAAINLATTRWLPASGVEQ